MKMKSYVIMFALMILLIAPVSALEFDDVLVPEYVQGEQYPILHVVNAFGLGGTIASFRIIENTDQCLIDCETTVEQITYEDGELLQVGEFITKNGHTRNLDYNLKYESEDLVDITVNDYENQCEQIEGEDVCNNVVVGTHEEEKLVKDWKIYKGGSVLADTYITKIEAKKEISDEIDWTISYRSIGPEEFRKYWAWWNTDWGNKREIVITDTAGSAVDNLTIDMIIPYDTDMNPSYSDIRFTDAAEAVELGYWIYFANTTQFRVRVKVEDNLVPKDNVSIFMYYNNAIATTTSDIAKAHIIGEDGKDFTGWSETDPAGRITLDTVDERLEYAGLQRGEAASVYQTIDPIVNFTMDWSFNFASWTTPAVASTGMTDANDVGRPGTISSGMLGVSVTTILRLDTYYNTVGSSVDTTPGIPITARVKINRHDVNVNLTSYSDMHEETPLASVVITNYGGATEPLTYAHMILGEAGTIGGSVNGWVTNYSIAKYVFPLPVHTVGAEQSLAANVSVSLGVPANGTSFLSGEMIFWNASLTPGPGNNLINATLFIYNSTGGIISTTTNPVTGTVENETDWSVSVGTVGVNTWNVYGCDSVSCVFADASKEVIIDAFNVTGEAYPTTTSEGDLESFKINISTLSGFQLSNANFIYNGSSNVGSIDTIQGGNYTVSIDFVIPDVGLVPAVVPFFWNFIFQDSSSGNSTEHSITVSVFNIDDCSVNQDVVLNLTLKDEENLGILNGTALNGTIDYDVTILSSDRSSVIFAYSKSNSPVNNTQVCVNSTALAATVFSLDATVRYFADTYTPEFYNIQNFTFKQSTIPNNIDLLDLLLVDSTEFQVTFRGSDFLPLPNALINIQRSYVGDGIFRTVEIPITDAAGQAKGHFDTKNVAYNIVVTKNGIIVATFNNIVPVCQDILTGECNIDLVANAGTSEFVDFATIDNINYVITFNETLRRINTQFVTSDGSTVTVVTNATLFDNFGDTIVCSASLSSSAGNLNCDIPASVGNATVIYNLFQNGQFITARTFTFNHDLDAIFDGQGAILALFLMLTLPFMALSNVIGFIVLVMIGFVLVGSLFFIETGSYIGPGSIFIWIAVTGFLIIWKMVKKRN